MSPLGKRRHNELNAAPPPENPRGTGKTGETNNRDVVHSGESFRIRGKRRLFGKPRGMIPTLASPRGLRSRGAAMNRSPGETENRSSACGTVFKAKNVALCLKDAPLALHLIRWLRHHLPLKGKAYCQSPQTATSNRPIFSPCSYLSILKLSGVNL